MTNHTLYPVDRCPCDVCERHWYNPFSMLPLEVAIRKAHLRYTQDTAYNKTGSSDSRAKQINHLQAKLTREAYSNLYHWWVDYGRFIK